MKTKLLLLFSLFVIFSVSVHSITPIRDVSGTYDGDFSITPTAQPTTVEQGSVALTLLQESNYSLSVQDLVVATYPLSFSIEDVVAEETTEGIVSLSKAGFTTIPVMESLTAQIALVSGSVENEELTFELQIGVFLSVLNVANVHVLFVGTTEGSGVFKIKSETPFVYVVGNELILPFVQERSDYFIYNANGKIQKSGTSVGNVAIEELPSGFYFIQAAGVVAKFIKE